MKTAISIPDDVFAQAERVAKRLGLSRSELFTKAVQAFLATRVEGNVTASYDAAFGDASDTEANAHEESFRREASRRALLNVEWDAD
jgi:metal-responsive CopG/Arc/MetJ family transcriptional regulator